MPFNDSLPENLRDCRAARVLERAIRENRLGHGILLHGDSPRNLEAIARAIAADLLQTARDPWEHPDCFQLRPSGKARLIRIGSESERTGGEWPRNTMRRLVLEIQKTSNQGGNKVAVIFEADRMNAQSANAFLKTLEEPPADTTLLLLTGHVYALPDTIRSRCLNFRVPSGATDAPHPNWPEWLESYDTWLRTIRQRPGKATVPHIILGAYGLNQRFQEILAEMTKATWDEQKAHLPPETTDDEKAAMEAGISRGYRKQLLAGIEKATADFARRESTPDTPLAHPLKSAIDALEHSTALLELNFNLTAALEHFFLRSMRIWIAN